ncbi:MAG: sulfatase-like hydrolase/transferase, partial [Gammaproteobacteria bacterium]|nr:sulfatase-like hydrolase/transferase [Gammaproteobacteria bacterium]
MLTLLVVSCAGLAGAADRPNVVLIIADYMGYSDIEPYGATDIQTPSLSRLADEGVKFTNFYAAAPVCGPARAALYTGRYPAAIGFEQNIRTEDDGLVASVPTLSRWLGDAGYRTALYGKWHLGYGPQHSPKSHGFESFLGHLHWTISYYSHVNDRGEPGLYDNDGLVDREGYLTDILSDEAVGFIEQNDDDPFFLTLAYNAALPPYQPPGLPASEWDKGWNVNEASREDLVGMIERMDDGIGRVLDALDATGKSDNTVVIYTHDHGGRHLVNHGPLFHGFANLFEGGIRVPAIIRYPRHLPAGKTESMPAIAMDL